MYLSRTPALVKPFLGDLVWSVDTTEHVVHLTFDDGPIPEVTPWVLDRLAEHGAQATFFCIGRNAAHNPEILERIRREGHAVGNHTWDHANGWKTADLSYFRSVLECDRIVHSTLFRPPYGRITRSQVIALRKRFTPVMWDVLSADFDTRIDGDRCTANVLRNVTKGSIVVFHDSVKAWPRLEYALPRTLEELGKRGYRFAALDTGATSRPASCQAPIPPSRS